MEVVDVETTSMSLPTPIVELQDPNVQFKYPFLSGENVELCAKGLTLCDYQADITHEEHISLQLDHITGNNGVVLFSTLDRGTLKPGTYVNDNVIDFWLLWVTRTEPQHTSNVKTFTSHFYTKIVKEGMEYVSKWNENRKLDIFTKKIVMLPINLSSHWSLLVVVNVHNLPTYFSGSMKVELDTELPFMMLLDSLGLHDSNSIAANVHKWLLYEWTTKTGNLEGNKVMQLNMVTPKVPRQKNGFDCGLFTCRYALGINKLKDQSYTYEDVYKSKTPLLKKLSNNAIFLFNQKLVDEFRTQLGKLCDNLYHVFHYNKVPRPSVGVSRRRSVSRRSTEGKNKKQVVHMEKAKVLDPALELQYSSPIIDLVRCKNRIVVPPAVSDDKLLPKLNLNAEMLQVGQKTFEPNTNFKPEAMPLEEKVVGEATKCSYNFVTTSEQKALEPATDINPEAMPLEEKAVDQANECSNNFVTTSEQKSLEPATDINPEAMPLEEKAVGQATKCSYNFVTTSEQKALEPTTSIAFVGRKVAARTNKRASATLLGSDISTAKSNKKNNITSKNNGDLVAVDPFIGKPVAFSINSPVVQVLKSEIGKQWTNEAICYHLEPLTGHIVGTVTRKSRGIGSRGKDGSGKYDVVWEFSGLGETAVLFTYLLEGHITAQKLLTERQKMKVITNIVHPKERKVTTRPSQLSDEECMMAPDSDDSSLENFDSNMDEFEPTLEDDWVVFDNPDSNFSKSHLSQQCFEEDPTVTEPVSAINSSSIPTVGLHWEYGAEIEEEPVHNEAPKKTTVIGAVKSKFKTPIDSFMMMCPVSLWEVLVLETNRYVEQKISKQTKRKRYFAGYKWVPVTLQDIMTYVGMLIYGMLYPQTGRRMRESWDSPYLSPWTKFMSRGRFQKISSVLHFNNNEDDIGMQSDGLHKVRPILNIIKKKLGKYAILGTEHSFDEATMACRSSYGRHLITFNAKKPTGKFHFKLYMLCCASTNLTHKIKIHTRDNSDRDELVENPEEEEAHNEIVSKIDALTLNMCNGLYNRGCTVNMDNYYMSTTCAIRLRQNGVLCRGTIRSSRKFVPKSILFSRSEVRTLPRGTQ